MGWCTVPTKLQPQTSVPPTRLMIGSVRWQTLSKNQYQAASFQGSPPEQVMRSRSKRYLPTSSVPWRIRLRTMVGDTPR